MRRALALALALAVLAACGGGDDDNDDAGPTTSTVTSTAGPFFLPSYLPVGTRITDGVARAEGPGHDAHGIAIARPGASPGELRDVVLVLIGEADRDRTLNAGEASAARAVDINGVSARLLESPVLGTSVDWFVDGLAIGVSGPVGQRDLVVDVARLVRRPAAAADSAAAGLTSVPAGYQVLADASFVDRTPEPGQSVAIESESGATIVMAVTRSPRLPLVFAASGGEIVRPSKVRGKEAIISVRTERFESGPRSVTTLVWREKDDVVISLSTTSEVTALSPIAEGMASVSEQEWRTTVPDAPQS